MFYLRFFQPFTVFPGVEGVDQCAKGGRQDGKRRQSFLFFTEMQDEERPEIREEIPFIFVKNQMPVFLVLLIFLFQSSENLFVEIGPAQETAAVIGISRYDTPLRGNTQIDGRHRSAVLNIFHNSQTFRLPLPFFQTVCHTEGIS